MRTLIEHEVAVPMRDGVVLRADVWRPDDGARHPAIVFRTPYGKADLRLDTLSPADCVAAGYAAVVQDVRGRFSSAGRWRPLSCDHEGPDGYDTVEWTAVQSWCDGDVCMAGTSYLGIVQWLAAAEDPPHLRAIAPAMTTSLSLDRQHTGPVDLTDVVTVGNLLAAFKDYPETIELNMHDVAACKRMQIDRASYEQLIDESEQEIDALRQALGT